MILNPKHLTSALERNPDEEMTVQTMATSLGISASPIRRCLRNGSLRFSASNGRWSLVRLGDVLVALGVPAEDIRHAGLSATDHCAGEGRMDDFKRTVGILNDVWNTNPATQPESDPINPGHYRGKGGLQAIDVIEAFDLGFCLGNVVKYVCREGGKGGVEDLKKAQWYLQREIDSRGS